MDELTHYNHLISRLLTINPPGKVPPPGQMEANLRWLVGLARPRAKVSDSLRERVRANLALPRSRPQGDGTREDTTDGTVDLLPEPERWLLLHLLSADLGELQADSLLCREAARLMRRLLNLLPELPREALLLQMAQGFSRCEIAYVLECSVPDADRLLREARAAIFQCVHDGRADVVLH